MDLGRNAARSFHLQQHRSAGLFQILCQASRRIGRIENEKSSAGLHDPQQGQSEWSASMSVYGDNVSTLYALTDKLAGQSVAQFVDLLIGPGHLRIGYRQLMRAAPRAQVE